MNIFEAHAKNQLKQTSAYKKVAEHIVNGYRNDADTYEGIEDGGHDFRDLVLALVREDFPYLKINCYYDRAMLSYNWEFNS